MLTSLCFPALNCVNAYADPRPPRLRRRERAADAAAVGAVGVAEPPEPARVRLEAVSAHPGGGQYGRGFGFGFGFGGRTVVPMPSAFDTFAVGGFGIEAVFCVRFRSPSR